MGIFNHSNIGKDCLQSIVISFVEVEAYERLEQTSSANIVTLDIIEQFPTNNI